MLSICLLWKQTLTCQYLIQQHPQKALSETVPEITPGKEALCIVLETAV